MKMRILASIMGMGLVGALSQQNVLAGNFDTHEQHAQSRQNTSTSVWRSPLSALAAVASNAYLTYCYYTGIDANVVSFDDARDMQDVVDLFNANRYWLTLDPTCSIENILAFRSVDGTQNGAGELHIKVVRERGNLIGFAAYRMKSSAVGEIIFLAINPVYRGKRYGEKLLADAVQELQERGAQIVELATRINNDAAQKLYIRFGFKQYACNYHYGIVSFQYAPLVEFA
jgi:ribosomal protein S18 acetylase RimI-like enzyme